MRKRLPLLLTLCLLLCLTACAVSRAAAPEATPTAAPSPTPCPHLVWNDGVCAACDAVCPHPLWQDGVCAFCGAACVHGAWAGGACVFCGAPCPHGAHDSDGRCLDCGERVPHTYINGVCACGAQPVLETGLIDPALFAPCPRQGTVQMVTYTTHDYDVTGGEPPARTKQMAVYLPCGYDPEGAYDVLILLHGMYGTESYWLLDQQQYYPDEDAGTVRTTDLLDNMIDAGLCRPMIVVTPTFYRVSSHRGDFIRLRDQEQFARELRQDIMPLLADRYATYAADGSQQALSAARAHFAFAGLSMGSIYGYNAVLPECLDLFGWYGCFSGSECDDLRAVARTVNEGAQEGLPVYGFYNSAGELDAMGPPHYEQYQQLLSLCPGLTEGENAWFTYITGAYHEYRAWGTGLYDLLPLLFGVTE